MHPQQSPTATELLVSWQLIWTRKLSGKPSELKAALDSHANLFPKGSQAEARARAERTVKSYSSDPHSIRALIKRGKSSLRRA